MCLLLAVLILLGKGDWLIAGYNTASEKERERYDVRRLRLVIGTFMVIVSVFVGVQGYLAERGVGLSAVVLLVLCVVCVVLANTWCKKRKG